MEITFLRSSDPTTVEYFHIKDEKLGAIFYVFLNEQLIFLGFGSNLPFIKKEFLKQYPYFTLKKGNGTPPFTLYDKKEKIKLLAFGTSFQSQVWEALLQIHSGVTFSYEALAHNIGNPKAQRAVGSAIGKNPISYWIPCHRVIHKNGQVGQYRWGKDIKEKLLQLEQ